MTSEEESWTILFGPVRKDTCNVNVRLSDTFNRLSATGAASGPWFRH